jgi:hypothetical protein
MTVRTVKATREPRTALMLTLRNATVVQIDKLAKRLDMSRARVAASTLESHFGPKAKATAKGAGR